MNIENNRVKGSHKRVATDIKKQILERVKTSGKTVKEVAEEFGVASGTIYTWLSESAGGEREAPLLCQRSARHRGSEGVVNAC